MAGADPMTATEPHDIQGLLRSGYGSLTEASFLLLRVADAAKARAWLAKTPVTSYGDLDARVKSALHIGFTAAGLRAFGLPEHILAQFPAEFVSGIAGDETRSRQLGDVGRNAPQNWSWGYREREPHLIVMLYAESGGLASLRQSVATAPFDAGFQIIAELPTSDLDNKEPFGFVDGISQPKVDWKQEKKTGTDADLEYGNLIALGEFVLGYENEYGLFTNSPSLSAAEDRAGILPQADGAPGRRDLGRNGTYLVYRQLEQDVRGFWRFAAGGGDFAHADRLATAMVGRTREGEPLAEPAERAIRGVEPDAPGRPRNNFIYDADAKGLRCPFGAHIRRSNPRGGDMPGGRQGLISQLLRQVGLKHGDAREDLTASSRFHRILRRGREYGDAPEPEAALAPGAPETIAGINFIGLNANIARQFEFVQSAWLMSARFNGMTGETDPLVGNRERLASGEATDRFYQPQAAGAAVVTEGLPQFITVRGGAYFFLPSVRALRFLAALG